MFCILIWILVTRCRHLLKLLRVQYFTLCKLELNKEKKETTKRKGQHRGSSRVSESETYSWLWKLLNMKGPRATGTLNSFVAIKNNKNNKKKWHGGELLVVTIAVVLRLGLSLQWAFASGLWTSQVFLSFFSSPFRRDRIARLDWNWESAHLTDTACLVPDHCNRINILIKKVTWIFLASQCI